jgi:hypothetical protein
MRLIAIKWIFNITLFCGLAFAGIGNQPVHAQDSEGEQTWPRAITGKQGHIVMYQPQVESRKDNLLTARAAISLSKTEDGEPEFGAVWFTAEVEIDSDDRTAVLRNFKVTKLAFADASEDKKKAIMADLQASAGDGAVEISLDRLIAALAAADKDEQIAADLDNKPPHLLIANKPAVLVSIDGAPKMVKIEKSNMLRVINSPYTIILDPKTKAYYLDGGRVWYQAKAVEGPWKNVEKVPAEIAGFRPKEDEDTKKAIDETIEDKRIPDVIVVTEPTELIVIDGEPELSPLVGTDLLYLANSETPLINELASGKYYLLLSGRWFVADKLAKTGWTFVEPGDLPESFAKIPEDHKLADIRSQVAGTPEAEAAVLEASVPQTSAIKRSEAKVEVRFDGEPEFQPIANTQMLYAVNSDLPVLKIDNKYYTVDQGVWFVADAPSGPWIVADSVPPEVEKIPPSNPTHNVKYVKVYHSTPETVYVGYTPGYTGSYIYHGVVYYGTGYHYRPWLGVFYWPRIWTWGFNAHYSPWYGWTYGPGYTRGPFLFPFAYGAALYASYRWYRPYRGVWGPGGYHSRRVARARVRHYRRTGVRPAHYRRHQRNMYRRPANRNRNLARPATRPANMRPATRARNNVYADRSGNVYRRNQNGWQKRDGKQWNQASLPAQQRPGTRPAQRPGAKPGQRPSAKPAQRPAAKPAAKKRPTAKNKPAARKSTRKKSTRNSTTRKKSTRSRQASNQRLNRDHRSRSRGSQRTRQHRSRGSGGGGRSRGGGGRRR